ncbi:MAG TPA: BrnT family toxin [Blastocatellia bacterium]|nr:BrnT family toxin [Blastocatellia bacterium]
MVFEFHEQKSITNRAKHGIDFYEAQQLWNDPNRIELPGRDVGEPRRLVIGQIDQRIWTACMTYRHDHQTIRIISVRRARTYEHARYEAARHHRERI